MNTIEELVSLINQHEGFSQEEKSTWVTRLQQEGLTDTLKEELKQLLQQKVDAEYNELGIELDEKSSEYAEAHKAMVADIDAAETTFKKEAKDLKTQSDEIQKSTSKDMDIAMADAARQSISGTL
ncbi:MAG: hypothetical protein AAB400_05050 [Patescibacteria group bacterium]